MSDRDRAYRILGLESDAAPDEIEEAYRDLKAVWHPDRFVDSPELREKAEEKQKAVEHAHQILRDYHASRKSLSEDVVSPSARGGAGSGRGPSILDDTLSERMGKSKQRFPIWIALFGLVAVAVAISFFTWSPVSVDPESETSEQERIVADVKAARSTGQERTEEEVAALEESSESGEGEAMKLPAPNSQLPIHPPNTRLEPSVAPGNAKPVLPTGKPENAVSSSAPPGENKLTQITSTEEIETPVEDSLERETLEEEPAISELAERSFQILRAKSDLANRLVEGAFAEFSYQNWKAVERSSTEVYVDLVARVIPQGREVHFVWAVDVEAQSVKPMSQAARDLQAGKR
jgi:curved DNA-binding protein CbpA